MDIKPEPAQDIPAKIFSLFLEELAKTPTPPEVVDGLRKTLIETRDHSESAISGVMFGEEI